MLKVIVMIDCDVCGQPFDRVALSCDRGPAAWMYLTAHLEAEATGGGWDLYAEHRCDECISDMMFNSPTVTDKRSI